MRIGQRTRKLRTFYDIGPLFHVQLSTTTGPLGTNVLVNHRCLSFFLMKPILSEISTFRNFHGGPEFAEHAIYARFALQLSFFLCLHPRLQRLRGPTVWDTFNGPLASHKCNSSCLTSDTVCVALATKEIDALLKNKWSVGNIYMVISSLSVYFLDNSVKFLFK